MAAGLAVACKLKNMWAERACVLVCVCRCTFRRFSGELWVKAERVIWFTCCGLERGLELSPVQFLQVQKMQETRKRVRNQTITGRLERVNICAGEAKTPSQINPLKSHHRLVRPIASCRLLNAHAGLLVHTQWELDLCPDSCTHTYAHTHTNTDPVAKTDGQ